MLNRIINFMKQDFDKQCDLHDDCNDCPYNSDYDAPCHCKDIKEFDWNNYLLKKVSVTKEEVDKIPTADVVEVRHGNWIVENNVSDWRDRSKYILLIKCSECGTTHFLGSTEYENEYNEEKLKTLGNYADYSYCGHCGAKMDRRTNNMATCRECLHFETCLNDKQQTRYYGEKEACNNVEDLCRYFLSKSDYVKRERGEWISVKDRLPTEQDAIEGGFVLANTKENVIIARWSDIIKFKEFVTHWQPLPEPPKGE